MKIKFVGAINHITGSCSWLQSNKTGIQFLVDCGMHQGNAVEHFNANEFLFDPEEISFILLTHAHLDHCGLIPKMYRDGFRGKVYSTAATAKLAEIGLLDSAKIQQANEIKIYTKQNVEEINFVRVDEQPGFYWEKAITVSTDIWAAFRRSSHILGAAAISVSWKTKSDESKTMCFSGDIGNNTKDLSYLPLMKPNKYPFPTTDYLLVESTYGDKNRDSKFKDEKNRLQEWSEILMDAQEKQGKVLVPVFSIHRSQEVLIDLIATLKKYSHELVGQKEKQWKILCHSPMIAKVCQVYFEEFNRYFEDRNGGKNYLYRRDGFSNHIDSDEIETERMLKFLFKINKYIFNDGKCIVEICRKKPANIDRYDVIIASSGMCEAGPICDYLEKYENDPVTTIVVTGYQASGKGREILSYANELKENSKQKGYAQVKNLSGYYSGHADQKVLLNFIFNIPPKYDPDKLVPATVFINHGGNHEIKKSLKLSIEKQAEKEINQRNVKKVLIAKDREEWFNLNTGKHEDITMSDLINEVRDIKRQVRRYSKWLCEIKEQIADASNGK